MKRTLFFCAPAVFFFITLGAVAQTVTFSEQPENVTVGVGRDVTLKCKPVVNDTAGIALWEVNSQNGSNSIPVSANNTNVLGATAYVGGGPSRPCLILMGLTSMADQAEVICRGTDMASTLTLVAATPSAFITVHCVPTFELTLPSERISVGRDVTNVASRFNSSVGGCDGVVLIICTHSTGNVTLASVNGAVTHLNPMGGWKRSDFFAEAGPAQSISVSCIASQDNFESVTVSVELQIVAGPLPVSCGTVCVIVIVVVLVVVVPCCVAGLVLGIILCYCCLCKERPDGMRTKSERLSEKEEKDVELT